VLCRNGRVKAIVAGYTNEIEEDTTGYEPMASLSRTARETKTNQQLRRSQ
jgi:hypothetical protein